MISNFSNQTIIFIVKETFCKRDYDRFGIKKLTQKGFNVIVWDLTKLYNEKYFSAYKPTINFNNYELVNSKKTLTKIFKGLNGNEVIILTMHYSYKWLLLYRLLSKYKMFYGFIYNNAIPQPGVMRLASITRSFKKPIKSNFSPFLNFIFKRIPPKFLKITSPNFILVGGDQSIQAISYQIEKRTDIIWGHSNDYEIFQNNKDILDSKLNIQPYALFIDQFWPFHPDFQTQIISPEYYYDKLNELFYYIEDKFNLSVIIAGHPERKKSDKSFEQYFLNRKVVYDEACVLTACSNFIIAHYSTSLNYAALLYKPIIFIYLDTLPEYYINTIRFMSESYSQPLYNIANNSYKNSFNKILNINKRTYDKMINDYIKSNKSPINGLYDILADYLTLESSTLNRTKVVEKYKKEKYESNDL